MIKELIMNKKYSDLKPRTLHSYDINMERYAKEVAAARKAAATPLRKYELKHPLNNEDRQLIKAYTKPMTLHNRAYYGSLSKINDTRSGHDVAIVATAKAVSISGTALSSWIQDKVKDGVVQIPMYESIKKLEYLGTLMSMRMNDPSGLFKHFSFTLDELLILRIEAAKNIILKKPEGMTCIDSDIYDVVRDLMLALATKEPYSKYMKEGHENYVLLKRVAIMANLKENVVSNSFHECGADLHDLDHNVESYVDEGKQDSMLRYGEALAVLNLADKHSQGVNDEV